MTVLLYCASCSPGGSQSVRVELDIADGEGFARFLADHQHGRARVEVAILTTGFPVRVAPPELNAELSA